MWTLAIFIVGTSVFLQATFASGKGLVEEDGDDIVGTITREDLERFVRGSTEFALKLFDNMNRIGEWHQSDILLSPISVWSALTTVWHGAQGETRSQIERVLNYGSSDPTQIHLLYQNLTNSLRHSPNGPRDYTLNLVNRVYLNKNFGMKDETLDNLGYEVERTMPSNNQRYHILYQQKKQPINLLDVYQDQWGNLSLAMLLINDVDFKGYWKQPFDSQNIRSDVFFNRWHNIYVDLMSHPLEQHKTAQSPELGCSALELPLEGDDVRMVILIPDENTTVSSLLSKLNVDTLTDLLDGLRLTSVHVWMPKFHAEQYRLLDYSLMALGITSLFTRGEANLNGFSDDETYAGYTIHYPELKFNANGIEVPASSTTVHSSSVRAKEFVINRYFVILIQHQPTGAILFLGVVKDPSP